MGKKSRSSRPPESALLLPQRPASSTTPIIDTHTHLLSTFEAYRQKYPDGVLADKTVWDFVRGMYKDQNVEAIVDVWCEAPVRMEMWREIADSAVSEEGRSERWGGVEYWFVMGVHPHEAKHYDDNVERDILEAMTHPRCVGWGEMGLDYHYDNSPRDVQQEVFARQLKHAVRLGKPLTIHTREADDDTERILKEHVPREHKIHIHCFTDTPAFGQRLLAHFPNLYIGITGVITFASNADTSDIVRHISSDDEPRILLETDAPYMVPANIYGALDKSVKGKLPISHSGMVPWTAEFVAGVLNGSSGETVGEGKVEGEAGNETGKEGKWDAEKVLALGRENARKVYGLVSA